MKAKWESYQKRGFQGETRWNEKLSAHTYYQIGGPVDLFLIPTSPEDLRIISDFLVETDAAFFLLGLGSNLLVHDCGFRGVVIKTSRLSNEISNDPVAHRLKLGASLPMSRILREAGAQGWGGFEAFAGIPGSVGGAIAMNAGTHLAETKDLLEAVTSYSLKPHFEENNRLKSELDFAYRRGPYLRWDEIIYSGQFHYRPEDPVLVKKKIQEMLERRKSSQPVDLPSCGSVFKNPLSSGLKSWQVIEKLSLRGFRMGNAMFSDKHANFIVNLGGASSQDVQGLIELAKMRAEKELGIQLEEEVRRLGFPTVGPADQKE